MKAVWFHCFAGVAGDMALGSLIDAGADLGPIRNQLNSLAIGQWTLDAEITQRSGLRATRIVINGAEDDTVSRPFRSIRSLLRDAELPERVRERSLAVFTRLAEVEAFIHDTDVEQVHFHEVGGVDAILDIVGTCLALEQLEIDAVYCSPVATGYGSVEAAHGTLPVPTPAVLKLLEGVPVSMTDHRRELTTPTGAALMTTLAHSFGAMPAFTSILASGYGAGTADTPRFPNCTQVVVGELNELSNKAEAAVIIEANVDDVTGEVLSYALAQLMRAGAHDAWITPILMKKGRPAHTVSVLCGAHQVIQLSNILTSETGSFGVRLSEIAKLPAERHFESIEVRGTTMRVKVSSHRAKAEFDDAAELAKRDDVPVRQIIAEVEAAWRREAVTENDLTPQDNGQPET